MAPGPTSPTADGGSQVFVHCFAGRRLCRICPPIRRPRRVVAADGTAFPRSGGTQMKAYMLITGSGPIVILTSHDSVLDGALVRKLAGKGIEKFIGYEIPIGLARERY